MLQFEKFIYLDKLPLISLFRYWVRSIFILSFALSLLGARLISSINLEFNLSKNLKNMFLILLPFIYLYLLILINQTPEVLGMSEYLKKSLSKIDPGNYYIWLSILIVTVIFSFVLLLLIRFKKSWSYFASILIVLMSFFDFYYFSKDVISHRLIYISETEERVKVPEYFHDRRAVVRSGLVGNQYLFIDSWSPFGYSNFVKNDYMNLLIDSNIDNYKHIIKKSSKTYEDVKLYRNLGIISSYQPKEDSANSVLIDLDTSPTSDLIKKYDGKVSLISKSEYGKFSFNFSGNQDSVVETYIKSDNGFRLKINGVDKTFLLDKSNVFMNFKLPSGDNTVEIYYLPSDFYLGLFITILGSILLKVFWKKLSFLV